MVTYPVLRRMLGYTYDQYVILSLVYLRNAWHSNVFITILAWVCSVVL
jgi:hypothetical protein